MSTAGPDINQLVDPDAHELLTATRWEPERARAAVASIATRTEEAFDPDELWPPHPLDQEPDEPPLRRLASLYLGAAGVIWALHALTRAGLTEPGRDWAPVAATLSERYLLAPDFEDVGAVPSLWRGEAGILLVAHTLAPAAWQEERLLDVVCANVDHPSRELMWGSPGTMLASQEMLARTGDERWRSAWSDAADRLWDAWGDDVWEQDLYGRRVHILGPAHGFAGIVHALAHGGLLDADRSRALAPRAASALGKHALRVEGLVQWRPSLEASSVPRRTQWCHGAPGIVATLGSLEPTNAELTELLVAGGELTWRAGPLAKGAGLCHGTAGNGYAFLALFARTGDELWLGRARAFAMHALEQVERAIALDARGRHTLWTGDPGTALFLASCIDAQPGFPTIDRW